MRGLVVTLRDVTERRRLERELTHRAFHDSLTGLANRVLLRRAGAGGRSTAARADGAVVGVLFIDLDDFKVVNDTLGHAVGDQLLSAVGRAARRRAAHRTTPRPGSAATSSPPWSRTRRDAGDGRGGRRPDRRPRCAEPFVIDGQARLRASASIGIATTRRRATTASDLLRQADLALYVAKGAGKGQWRRYQPDLHTAMVERLELRAALDQAVDDGPVRAAVPADRRPAHRRRRPASRRWCAGTTRPAAGCCPDEFIEVAEETGLIVPIGDWVLHQAAIAAAQLARQRPAHGAPYVSVNVSARQFRTPGFVDQVARARWPARACRRRR